MLAEQCHNARGAFMTSLLFHVAISLIGIASGLVVLYGLIIGRSFGAWTVLFLATTILTSVSGFPLAPFGFDPPRAIGILSLVLLAVAVIAYYTFSSGGSMALGLRNHRHDCALSECFRGRYSSIC
jgi:ABC-type amino acid transport system permease subunit